MVGRCLPLSSSLVHMGGLPRPRDEDNNHTAPHVSVSAWSRMGWDTLGSRHQVGLQGAPKHRKSGSGLLDESLDDAHHSVNVHGLGNNL